MFTTLVDSGRTFHLLKIYKYMYVHEAKDFYGFLTIHMKSPKTYNMNNFICTQLVLLFSRT